MPRDPRSVSAQWRRLLQPGFVREQKKISANLDAYDPILTDITYTLVRLPHPADR